MQLSNLKSDIDQAIKEYPGLEIINEAGALKLNGTLELIHPIHNVPFETFSVELYYPEQYPHCFPKVIETGGKIERSAARHVNVPDNNTLCLTVPPEERLLCRHGITTSSFIKDVLLPRLGEEYEVNSGGKYLHEYSHNALGYWEFYFRKFNVKNPNRILEILDMMVKHNLPKGYENCFCGSGDKFKKCHQKSINEFSSLGNDYIKMQIQLLNKHKPN